MVPWPTAGRLLSVLGEAVDFAADHPLPASAILAAYVWLLLFLLQPIERP
jgi:hypothetical protein